MRARDFAGPEDVCFYLGVQPLPPAPGDKLGLARSARFETPVHPVHGLRVNPTPGVSGWYIWAGEMSEADDFFEPTHAAHVHGACPLALPFLSLPPGWRFLTDGHLVDVWFDPDIAL